MQFEWSQNLRARTPETVDWSWRGMIAPGAITLLHSRPKAGKSKTLAALAGALVDPKQTEFLGREVATCPVLLASEEGASTLTQKLPDGVRVVCRDDAFPKPKWCELVDTCVAEALRIEDVGLGRPVIVLDTYRFWGGLQGEAEKDAGANQALLDKLAEAAAQGLAIVLVHHNRKSGGEDSSAAAGSNAIVGAVDIALELEKSPDHRSNQRSILGVSRFAETPGALTFEWDKATDTYTVIGEADDRAGGRATALSGRILDALGSEASGLTRADIETATGVAWKQLLPAISVLQSEGRIERDGAGKAGDPYRFKSVQHRHAQTRTDMSCVSVPPLRNGTDAHTPMCVQSDGAQTLPNDDEIAEVERIATKFPEVVA